MNKIGIYLSVIMLLLTAPQSNAQSVYEPIFGNDYRNALEYMQENRLLHLKICRYTDVPTEVVLSAIFPERIRYSIVRDYLETETMKIFYINNGSQFADFSIGDFQLKASFAEQVEDRIQNYPELRKKYKALHISDQYDSDSRRIRITRLQNVSWQLLYISAFYDIINLRFGMARFSIEEQIRFTASAYNHGFTSPKERIERYADKKFFPYGAQYPREQYAYADVAVDFFRHHYRSIYSQ